MRILARFTLAIAAVLVSSMNADAQTQTQETGGGWAIVGSGATNTSYYAPTGFFGDAGSNFYLYYMGFDNVCTGPYTPGGSCQHDSIWVEKKQNIWSDLTSSHYTSRQKLLPNDVDQTDPCLGGSSCFYAGPSAFGYGGKYFMTVVKTPDAAKFTTVLLGVSSDGWNWTWDTLMTVPVSGSPGQVTGIPSVSLQVDHIGSNDYAWGFGTVNTSGGLQYVFPLRIQLQAGGTRPLDFVNHIELRTIAGTGVGAWTTVTKGGQYSGNLANLYPVDTLAVSPSLTRFKAPTLPVPTANAQLWTSVAPGSRQMKYQLWSADSSDPGTGFHRYGSDQLLGSLVRTMPGSYDASRATPFLVGGDNILYSSANDAHDNGTFFGQQIMMTVIQ